MYFAFLFAVKAGFVTIVTLPAFAAYVCLYITLCYVFV